MSSALCRFELSVLACIAFGQVRITGGAGSQAWEVLRKRGLVDDDGVTRAGLRALVVSRREG